MLKTSSTSSLLSTIQKFVESGAFVDDSASFENGFALTRSLRRWIMRRNRCRKRSLHSIEIGPQARARSSSDPQVILLNTVFVSDEVLL